MNMLVLVSLVSLVFLGVLLVSVTLVILQDRAQKKRAWLHFKKMMRAAELDLASALVQEVSDDEKRAAWNAEIERQKQAL